MKMMFVVINNGIVPVDRAVAEKYGFKVFDKTPFTGRILLERETDEPWESVLLARIKEEESHGKHGHKVQTRKDV